MDCRVIKPGNDMCFRHGRLVPAIHVFLAEKKDVDARPKAGHDGGVCGGIA